MASEKIKREAKEEHESVAEEEREHEHHARGGSAHPTHAGHRSVSSGTELLNEGPHPGDPVDPFHPGDKRGGGAHRRRARGGSTPMKAENEKAQEYNAQGSNEMKEAGDETPGFKKGGAHHKRRHGGHAEGKMDEHRLDRRPRRAQGGRTASHNPYSSASKMENPEDKKSARGHEGGGNE